MSGGFTRDAAERIVWTAIQAFVATMIASPIFSGVDADWTDALKVAGLAALLSLGKSILALNFGSDNTAQLGADTYVNKEK